MMVCQVCQKGIHKLAVSRHKKGASGASKWPLRAPIHKRIQKPNLHSYHGMRLCTKCLRAVKVAATRRQVKSAPTPAQA